MTQIVQAQIANVPSPISPALDRKLSFFATRLTESGLGHEIASTDAPSPDDREAMGRRQVAIANWMYPADQLWLLDQVTALLASPMPRRDTGGSVDASDLQIKIYGSTLKELPQFALAQTFKAAMAGQVGQPPFMPTQAELHIHASRICESLRSEARKIRNVLEAKVVHIATDTERRKANADRARAIIQEGAAKAARVEAERCGRPMHAPAEPAKPETPDEALARLAATASDPLPQLDDEILGKMGAAA